MWEQFNRYYLTKQIDSKSSRSIYLAHHVNNGSQKVMLEIFDAACFTFDQYSENIFQKIEMIKQLRHSSIVPILDLGVEQGRPYVVRQYHTSDSLHHRLDRLSPQRLNVQEALSIILQVGQGLSYAHEHQILHGSIKPETIFCKSNGEILLSDFGLASFIDITKLSQKSDPRTISYMAPEQFVGSLTEKSDQYALACLAYELITGYVPFSAQSTFSVTFPISVEEVSGEAIKRGESEDRDQSVLVHAGSFCGNSQCPDYGKVGKNNIHKYGKTRKGEQRWQCKTCQTTWSSSSMWAKEHPELLIPPADLVPDLLEPIQKAVLKAIAKDPSDRYSTVSLFLEALETASSSATAVISSSPLMAPSFSTSVTTVAKPLKNKESDIPLPTRLNEAPSTTRLAERSEHVYNGYDSGKTLVTPAKDTSLGSRRSHAGKSPTPTLWLAFALSGVILLLGTMMLYVFVPLRSPGSSNPVKGSPTIPIGTTPIIPVHHAALPLSPTASGSSSLPSPVNCSGCSSLPPPVNCSECWLPPLVMTMQWQLNGTVDQSYSANLYDIDLFDNSSSVVASLQQAGHKVTCSVDAGTWENWRPDKGQFPQSVLGKNVDGWAGEQWLDIRQTAVLFPILQARIDLCKSKGFDAIEFDNVDGYTNNTGFPLNSQDQLVFNTWLANQAHARGLSVALTNDLDQVTALLPYFDWMLDEQCFQYSACDNLLPFIKAGKPVVEVEYSLEPASFCPKANALNINAQKKNRNLDASRTLCR